MIIQIDSNDIFDRVKKYFMKICGFSSKTRNLEKKVTYTNKIYKKYFFDSSMKILVKNFDKSIIGDKEFIFNDKHIQCNVLDRISKESILGGYMYIFSSPQANINEQDILEFFYADTWQTAFMDAGRDVLREKIIEIAKDEYGEESFVTDSFGPGFYGMMSEKVEDMYDFIEGKSIGIELTDYGMMKPVKSIVGLFLVLNQHSQLPSRDCSSCLAEHTGCEFCKNSNLKYKEVI